MKYISKELALKYLLNKESIFEKVKNSFLSSYQNHEKDYKKLFDSKDFYQLEEYVHSLKGLSLNIGAKPLYDVCVEALEYIRFKQWDVFVLNKFYEVLKHTYEELNSL